MAHPSTSTQDSLRSIEAFLAQVKSAEEAHTEAGSIGGPTEHPVKNVDDGTQTATEGERSAENTRDVKEDQGAPSVDSTPEAKAAALLGTVSRLAKRSNDGPASTPGSAADDQIQIGTNKQPTGEDPSVETASAKGGKDDPGSKHPARTDNDALEGGKYASDKFAFDAETSFDKAASMVSDLGNLLCADIHAMSTQMAAAATKTASAPAAAPAIDPVASRQAGWELAGLLDGSLDKRAADELVVHTIADIIKSASDRADLVVDYLNAFFKAAAEESDPQDPSQAGPGDSAGPGDPAAPDSAGGQQGGLDPSMAGGGGMDPAMMGGVPPAGGGAPPVGGGDDGSVPIEVVEQILQSLHITPEQLQQAEAAMSGGGTMGGGAADAGAGGAPGGGAGEMPPDTGGMESSAADRSQQKTAAARPSAQQIKEASRQHIIEIIARSRRQAR